jgi:TonB family protein
MKNNIIIKMEPFEISDSEIREYMDFPGVLSDHKRVRFPWKFLLEIIAILSVTGILIFFNTKGDDTVSTVSEPISQEQSHVEQENIPETKKMMDSVQIATDADKKDSPLIEKNQNIPPSSPSSPKEEMLEKTDDPVPSSVEVSEDLVFIKAEPKDGMTALYDYFDEHLEYPATELGSGVEGKTLVTFTVYKDGSIGEILFDSSLGESFDQEAVRVLKQMSPWLPARVNDEPVDSKISIPLYFEER